MILTLIFCVGRVMHQLGYTIKGYGGHAGGFTRGVVGDVHLLLLLLVPLHDPEPR